MLATAHGDGAVRVWDPALVICHVVLRGHAGEVKCVAWEETGERLLSGGVDKTVRAWALQTGEAAPVDAITAGNCIQVLKGHSDVVTSVMWSPFVENSERSEPPPGGTNFLSGSRDETVKVWGPVAGASGAWRCIATLTGHTAPVRSCAYDAASKFIASCSHDSSVKVWEVQKHQEFTLRHTLEKHQDIVTTIAWQRRAPILATGSDDCTAIIWDAAKGEMIKQIKGHKEPVTALAWCHDENLLAIGCKDKMIRIWHVGKSECIVTLIGHAAAVRSLSWSEDGNKLATVSADPRPLVWLAAEGCYVKQVEAAIFGEELEPE